MWRQYEKDMKAIATGSSLLDKKSSSLPAIANIAYDDSGSRVQDLESRIKLSEQSNRLLLEEMMKLQQDLKMALRQNEEMVMKERGERISIRDKLEAAESLYAKISMQLLRTEEKVNMEHTTLASLMNQSKEVERALAGGEQRSMMKGEQVDRYMTRFREELNELRQVNEHVNNNMRSIGEDVKTLKHRLEMQNSEFASTSQEIKQKMKRLEGDSVTAMENIRKQDTMRDSFDASSHLKHNVDSRFSELQDSVNETRRKTDVEASERRTADQQAQLNVEKLQVTLRELETKYQEIVHKAKFGMREKENEFETEKNTLVFKMAELSEDQNKKALQREIKLREEAHGKFVYLEQKIQEEQAVRLTFEKSMRQEVESILDALKTHLSQELQSMNAARKLTPLTPAGERGVNKDEGLMKMHECITLLESEIEAGKRAFEEVLHAEIMERQKQNENVVNQLQEFEEHLASAVGSMREAISGINSQTQNAVEEMRNELQVSLDQINNTDVSGLGEIDERLNELSEHLSAVDQALHERPAPVIEKIYIAENNNEDNESEEDEDNRIRMDERSLEMYKELEGRMERTDRWQEGAEETFKELAIMMEPLHLQIESLKNEIDALQENLEERKDRVMPVMLPPPQSPQIVESNMNAEQEGAQVDTKLESRVQKMEGDIYQLSSQFEKLEGTVTTLRTVLSQQISSEAQTRGKDISDMKEQLKQLQHDPRADNEDEFDQSSEKGEKKEDMNGESSSEGPG